MYSIMTHIYVNSGIYVLILKESILHALVNKCSYSVNGKSVRN